MEALLVAATNVFSPEALLVLVIGTIVGLFIGHCRGFPPPWEWLCAYR